MDTDEYHAMEREHLRVLIFDGRALMVNIEGSAHLLELESLGQLELSEDEKKELLKMLIDAARKYMELIQRSIDERNEFLAAKRDTDNKPPPQT